MKINSIFLKLTKKIVKYFFNIESYSTFKVFKIIYHLWANNGYLFMIKYMKTVRLHITRYMVGKPLLINDTRVSLINGFPKRFYFLKKFIDEGNKNTSKSNYIRYVLTLMNITRGLNPTKVEEKLIKPSFDSITNPSKVTRDYHIPEKFIEDFLIRFNLKVNKETLQINGSNHYISTKGSPEGKTSYASRWSIFGHTWSTMNYILKIIGTQSFSEIFTKQWEALYDKYGENDYKLGKLAIIKDPEGKRRVIAMVDYHSQLVLRSIHEECMKNIQHLPQDRTFTQDPHNKWDNGKDLFWSLDLSSATDRFPIYLQQKVMRNIYDSDAISESWKNLLVDRDYYYKDEYTKVESNYRYSVGQPMGAYSSWIIFTITHHLVVHYAAHLCGIEDFNQYILLGDDIVIKNNKVADKYKGIMMRLGVDISPAKTHVSKTTYEFAKRWVRSGIELSGLPLKGIFNNIRSLQKTFSIIYEYNQTCGNHKMINSLDLMSKIFDGLRIGKRTYRFHNTKRYLWSFYHSYRYSQGNLTLSELRNYIAGISWDIESMLPNDKLIPLFTKGVLSSGITAVALETLSDLKNHKKKLMDSFDDDIISTPIIHGIRNRLSKILQRLELYRLDKITFNDIIKEINPINIDSLSRKDRDSIIVLDYLNSAFKSSFIFHYEESDDEMKEYLSSFVNTKFGIELEDQWSYSFIERIESEIAELDGMLEQDPVKETA
ncbi:RNA-dependent RNA polymerase [Rugonectria rugulosa mitovirus 1]|nr:RNA-dependent RNA polymerase [Rugonectria rugulosa mitovirus 1]